MLTPRTSRARAYSAELLAERYGVHRVLVSKLCRTGEIPAFKIGRDYRILPEVAESEAVASLLLEREAKTTKRTVYFITADKGPIKIGLAGDPQGRLRGLQTGYPYLLRIAASAPGGIRAERQYHARFAEHRLQGEWFERHPDILAEIDCLSHPTPTQEMF